MIVAGDRYYSRLGRHAPVVEGGGDVLADEPPPLPETLGTVPRLATRRARANIPGESEFRSEATVLHDTHLALSAARCFSKH
jgi:hypothetical protein